MTGDTSLALAVWEIQYFEDIFTKDDLINESVNDDGVFRTAPATPGVLINNKQIICKYIINILLQHDKYMTN